jgi:hypothetical protein
MSGDTGFRRTEELAEAVAAAARALAGRNAGLEELERACSDARELYERLVVLRHKAREAAAHGKGPLPSGPLAPEPVVAEPIRLDTRPPATRQTSLIDAIEAAVPPAPEAAAPAPKAAASGNKATTTPTLAEKLTKSPITDLPKAISVSHKFWFTTELFAGDRTAYEAAIARLNAMPGRAEALALLEGTIATLKKPADPEALAAFIELLERRYP